MNRSVGARERRPSKAPAGLADEVREVGFTAANRMAWEVCSAGGLVSGKMLGKTESLGHGVQLFGKLTPFGDELIMAETATQVAARSSSSGQALSVLLGMCQPQ